MIDSSCDIGLWLMPQDTFVDNITGSGNDLVPSANKPSCELMLTQIGVSFVIFSNNLVTIW